MGIDPEEQAAAVAQVEAGRAASPAIRPRPFAPGLPLLVGECIPRTLVNLLADPDADVCSRAVQGLGNWGRKNAGAIEVVLKKLGGQAEPALVALLQRSGPEVIVGP